MTRFRIVLFAIISIMSLFLGCSDDDSSQTEDPNAAINAANRQPLGTSANQLLSSDEFTSLRVELAYSEGFRPTQTTIDLLVPFLEERLDKPGGITLVESIITSEEEGPYDIDEIVAIEDANRTVFNDGEEIGVWLFFSDERSSGDSGNSVVLGTAYRNTSMVVYERTFIEIGNNPATPVNRTLIESSTIRHEFGHIFGLVNIGTPLTSNHEDENNPRHCNVQECLMFFQTVTNSFNNGNLESLANFDPLCVGDLQANGGL